MLAGSISERFCIVATCGAWARTAAPAGRGPEAGVSPRFGAGHERPARAMLGSLGLAFLHRKVVARSTCPPRRDGARRLGGSDTRQRAPGSRSRRRPRVLRAGRPPARAPAGSCGGPPSPNALWRSWSGARRGARTTARIGQRPRSRGSNTSSPAASGRSTGETVTTAGIATTGSSPPPRSDPSPGDRQRSDLHLLGLRRADHTTLRPQLAVRRA
jgi:hypothetical protein